MKITITLLTGAMRSGTSVLGKVVGSFESVEFFYEPLTFVKLLLSDNCRGLIDDYVYHDLLMPSLAGRNINLNAHDDSSIWNYKSKAFIEERLSRSWPTDVIHDVHEKMTCLIKYPSFVDEFAEFESESYPVRKILIVREPIGNVLSILRKRWFSDEVLNSGIRGEFKQVDGRNVPLWLGNDEVDLFFSLDEMGRCLFYYTHVLGGDISGFNVVVSYEALCNRPQETVSNLASRLGLVSGELTGKLIEGMRPEKVQHLEISKTNQSLFEEAMTEYNRALSLIND